VFEPFRANPALGLAGAGAGFEQERGVEVAHHAVADGLVGGRAGHADAIPAGFGPGLTGCEVG
jgi:hypothetical protein